MKRGIQVCVVLLAFLALAGCSAIEAKSQAKPGLSFSGYRTFSWLPGTGESGDGRIRQAPYLDPQIRAEVEGRLDGAGLTKVMEGEGDLEVGYQLLLLDEYSTVTIDESIGYDAWWIESSSFAATPMNPVTQTVLYERGTLAVDLVDARRNEVVWRGSASARIYEEDPKGEGHSAQRVRRAVGRMFRGFPPK
jgi:hypothetical protein